MHTHTHTHTRTRTRTCSSTLRAACSCASSSTSAALAASPSSFAAASSISLERTLRPAPQGGIARSRETPKRPTGRHAHTGMPTGRYLLPTGMPTGRHPAAAQRLYHGMLHTRIPVKS
eukprot:2313336-Prymnesium_polylepis.1